MKQPEGNPWRCILPRRRGDPQEANIPGHQTEFTLVIKIIASRNCSTVLLWSHQRRICSHIDHVTQKHTNVHISLNRKWLKYQYKIILLNEYSQRFFCTVYPSDLWRIWDAQMNWSDESVKNRLLIEHWSLWKPLPCQYGKSLTVVQQRVAITYSALTFSFNICSAGEYPLTESRKDLLSYCAESVTKNILITWRYFES